MSTPLLIVIMRSPYCQDSIAITRCSSPSATFRSQATSEERITRITVLILESRYLSGVAIAIIGRHWISPIPPNGLARATLRYILAIRGSGLDLAAYARLGFRACRFILGFAGTTTDVRRFGNSPLGGHAWCLARTGTHRFVIFILAVAILLHRIVSHEKLRSNYQATNTKCPCPQFMISNLHCLPFRCCAF